MAPAVWKCYPRLQAFWISALLLVCATLAHSQTATSTYFLPFRSDNVLASVDMLYNATLGTSPVPASPGSTSLFGGSDRITTTASANTMAVTPFSKQPHS